MTQVLLHWHVFVSFDNFRNDYFFYFDLRDDTLYIVPKMFNCVIVSNTNFLGNHLYLFSFNILYPFLCLWHSFLDLFHFIVDFSAFNGIVFNVGLVYLDERVLVGGSALTLVSVHLTGA
jgi:hypothetical protein